MTRQEVIDKIKSYYIAWHCHALNAPGATPTARADAELKYKSAEAIVTLEDAIEYHKKIAVEPVEGLVTILTAADDYYRRQDKMVEALEEITKIREKFTNEDDTVLCGNGLKYAQDLAKKVLSALDTYLSTVWKESCKLYAEGDKLCAEGDKLCAEGRKLYAEGDRLYTEGDKLCAEGDRLCAEGRKLYAEGDKLYAEAVTKVHGKKAIINWNTGEVVK